MDYLQRAKKIAANTDAGGETGETAKIRAALYKHLPNPDFRALELEAKRNMIGEELGWTPTNEQMYRAFKGGAEIIYLLSRCLEFFYDVLGVSWEDAADAHALLKRYIGSNEEYTLEDVAAAIQQLRDMGWKESEARL